MPTKSSKFSVKRARALQSQLSKKVILEDVLPRRIRLVAGVDVAYAGSTSIGAVAVLDFRSLSPIEFQVSLVETRFPYVPTLLSFREISPAVAAIRKLRVQPDVFLVDGHGFAHPYRFGFASHLGIVLNKPTVGVAKSLLCGRVGSFKEEGWAPILEDGETIGATLVTKQDRKPVYVSVGHMISLETAITLVRHCIKDHRVPEPLRMAHLRAMEAKKALKGELEAREKVL